MLWILVFPNHFPMGAHFCPRRTNYYKLKNFQPLNFVFCVCVQVANLRKVAKSYTAQIKETLKDN